MENFESLLEKEISDSIIKHPEKWNTSIMGVRREDGLDLNLSIFESISDVSIYSPYKYVFKDEKIKRRLWKLATNLQQSIRDKRKKAEEIDSEKKLSDFLNLDSRKNKLKRLEKLNHINSNLNEEKKYDIELNSKQEKHESFFQKLINKLK